MVGTAVKDLMTNEPLTCDSTCEVAWKVIYIYINIYIYIYIYIFIQTVVFTPNTTPEYLGYYSFIVDLDEQYGID